MTPQAGSVGTQVTISIVYNYPQPQVSYKVLWSRTLAFSTESTKVLKEGLIPNGAAAISAQVVVPESEYGMYYLRFKPDSGSTYNFQFNVLPKLQVNPSSVVSGGVVSISGNGFPANDTTTFKIHNQFLGTRISTNDTGSFSGQLVTPTLSAGNYELTAMTELVTLSSSTTLEILPPPIVNEDKPPVIPDSTTNIPANGSTANNIPSKPERKIISAPAPKSIIPADEWIGITGPQQVTLQWAPVSGETGITYAIEINEKRDFSSGRLIRESGITGTSYTTILEPGIYYWRVKVNNHEGSESYWSYGSHAIKVGELSTMIAEFIEVINKNGETTMIIVCSLGAFIILMAILSSAHSVTKLATKSKKK